jgi:hypothetical protein
VPGLLTLWARTKGTPQEVRGISALSSQPFLLNTRDPNIKTIKDFKDSDRIAVPAVKSSVQALTLQMAAAKTYGEKEFEKLDPLTVSMTPPDATVALLKGGAQITAALSVPPFQYQQLEDKSVHTVLNSFDVMAARTPSPRSGPRPNSAIRIRRSTRPSSPRSRRRPRSLPRIRARPPRSGLRIPNRSFRSTPRARLSLARRCTGR